MRSRSRPEAESLPARSEILRPWARVPRQRLSWLRAHGRSAVILAGQVIPANANHLLKHPRPIHERMNPRVSAVTPKHRHLFHAKAKLARQKKNLRIEAPALDSLQWQDRLRGPASESLEPALRVFESQPQNNPK